MLIKQASKQKAAKQVATTTNNQKQHSLHNTQPISNKQMIRNQNQHSNLASKQPPRSTTNKQVTAEKQTICNQQPASNQQPKLPIHLPKTQGQQPSSTTQMTTKGKN